MYFQSKNKVSESKLDTKDAELNTLTKMPDWR